MLNEQNMEFDFNENTNFLKAAVEQKQQIEYFYDKISLYDYINPNKQIGWIIHQYYNESDEKKLFDYLSKKMAKENIIYYNEKLTNKIKVLIESIEENKDKENVINKRIEYINKLIENNNIELKKLI
jgi:hypothetical protein